MTKIFLYQKSSESTQRIWNSSLIDIHHFVGIEQHQTVVGESLLAGQLVIFLQLRDEGEIPRDFVGTRLPARGEANAAGDLRLEIAGNFLHQSCGKRGGLFVRELAYLSLLAGFSLENVTLATPNRFGHTPLLLVASSLAVIASTILLMRFWQAHWWLRILDTLGILVGVWIVVDAISRLSG